MFDALTKDGHALILEMNKNVRIKFDPRVYKENQSVVSNTFGVCKQNFILHSQAEKGMEHEQVVVCVEDLKALLNSQRPFSRCF